MLYDTTAHARATWSLDSCITRGSWQRVCDGLGRFRRYSTAVLRKRSHSEGIVPKVDGMWRLQQLMAFGVSRSIEYHER